ncbi:MAG TPA: hypothetical protein VMD05_08970 [Candidatus Nanoarchaeia archaeon]|nr:hypothetical protein [Candidatus Nanoarchaeia archaeon]
MSYLIIGNITLESLLLTIVGLIILWIIVSIPVWLAGKAVTGGKATFGEAMIATLFGPIVYAITLLVVDFLLGAVVGSAAYVIAFLLALIAWVWVYKASFKTGWLGAIAIAILAWIIFLVLSIILGILFGVVIPHTFFPQL